MPGLHAYLLLEKSIGKVIPPSFIAFSLVTAIGVAIYFSLFFLALFSIRTTFDMAQWSAAAVATTLTFFLNNNLTFRATRCRGYGTLIGLASFYLVCGVGRWIEFKITHAAAAFGAEWYTAEIAGLAFASVWNYALTQKLTWRPIAIPLPRLSGPRPTHPRNLTPAHKPSFASQVRISFLV